MAANSAFRRLLKRLLAPLLSETTYSHIQAVAKARDIRSGEWWEPELELCAKVLREGDSALDIGANFGVWSYYMSRAVGQTGKVFSFEPIPFTARTFRKVARKLDFQHNVRLIEAGCGEGAGAIEFTVPVAASGAISSGQVHMGRNDARPGKEQHARFDETRTVSCQVVRLDDQLQGIERLSLVKCDIEGADLFAMRGARAILASHKPVVIIEINPWFLTGFGLRVEDMFDFFDGLGYSCYHYDDDKTLTPTSSQAVYEDNWIFVHEANAERVADLIRPR